MTAHTMQIGNRPCRIYGEAPCRIPAAPNDRRTRAAKHGKRGYRYCTECAPLSVCGRARGKLERCTFSVGSPCCVGKARIWWQGYGNPVLSDRAGHSHTEAAVSSPGKCQNHSGRLLAGRDCLHCGHPPRLICSTVSLPPRPLCGFRDGWSLNSSTRYRHSAFI